MSARPTCKSPVVDSNGPSCRSADASARSYSRRASAGRPRVSHMLARTTVAPSSSAMLPALCRLATAVLNVSTAVPGVAGGPRGQAEEAGRGPAGEMVIRPGQLQHVTGVRDGAVDVAAGLGDRGAIGRDRGREGPQLLVPGASGRGQRTGDSRYIGRTVGLPRPFGIIEPRLGTVEIAFGEPRPGQEGGQQGAAADDVVRQGAQPLP